MIADRIEHLLNDLNAKTMAHALSWRPIDEYTNYCNDNKYISEKILMMKTNEFVEFYIDKSFFVRKDNSYLFLLSYKETSANDGTVSERCELYASFYPNSEIIKIPSYIDGGIETIRNSILDYWEYKKGCYSADVSDIFELLKKFSE